METIDVQNRSFVIRWLDGIKGDEIEYQVKPLKKSVKLEIYKKPRASLHGNLPSAVHFAPDTKALLDYTNKTLNNRSNPTVQDKKSNADFSSNPQDPKRSLSLSNIQQQWQEIPLQERLTATGFTLVKNVGVIAGNNRETGFFSVKDNDYYYAFVLDNTYSKSVRKRILFSAAVVNQDERRSSRSLRFPKSPVLSHQAPMNDLEKDGIMRVEQGRYLQGYLFKKRRKKHQGFKKRFFSLDYKYGTLFYHLSEQNQTCRGEIVIGISTVSANKKDRLIIIDSGMELWVLKARDRSTWQIWIHALQSCFTQRAREMKDQNMKGKCEESKRPDEFRFSSPPKPSRLSYVDDSNYNPLPDQSYEEFALQLRILQKRVEQCRKESLLYLPPERDVKEPSLSCASSISSFEAKIKEPIVSDSGDSSGSSPTGHQLYQKLCALELILSRFVQQSYVLLKDHQHLSKQMRATKPSAVSLFSRDEYFDAAEDMECGVIMIDADDSEINMSEALSSAPYSEHRFPVTIQRERNPLEESRGMKNGTLSEPSQRERNPLDESRGMKNGISSEPPQRERNPLEESRGMKNGISSEPHQHERNPFEESRDMKNGISSEPHQHERNPLEESRGMKNGVSSEPHQHERNPLEESRDMKNGISSEPHQRERNPLEESRDMKNGILSEPPHTYKSPLQNRPSAHGSLIEEQLSHRTFSEDEVKYKVQQSIKKDLLPLPWHDFVKRRNDIPVQIASPPSLLSFMRKNVGKDLSSIAMPVTANEPVTILQATAEMFEYANLLTEAASHPEDHLRCLQNVSAFAVSCFSVFREKTRVLRKPFTPLLTETFELVREDMGYRLIAEKVSHKPLVCTFHVEHDLWECSYTVSPIQKFWGKSMELNNEGTVHLKFKQNDQEFEWVQPTAMLKNLIAGERYMEPVNELEIKSSNGGKATVAFKNAGMFGGRSEELTVNIVLPKKNKKHKSQLTGKWTEYIKESETQRTIWRVGKLVPNCKRKYGFTIFTSNLNEITTLERDRLPPTDSRLRPDLRAYENGKIDQAESLKLKLEKQQRERRTRGEDAKPKFFKKVGKNEWEIIGGPQNYWERRKHQDWSDLTPLW